MADGGEQRRFDTKIHTTRNDRKIRLSLVFVASYKLVYHSISFFKDHFNKGRFLIEENFFLDQNLCKKVKGNCYFKYRDIINFHEIFDI